MLSSRRVTRLLGPVLLLPLAAVSLAPADAAAGTATLSGRVTATADGKPLANVEVRVQGYKVPSNEGSATTRADGTWKIAGLDAGTFAVHFEAPMADGDDHPYLSQAWDHVDDDNGFEEKATPIRLASGEQRTGIDASLVRGGRIAGVLTLAGGGPGADSQTVTAYRKVGDSWVYESSDFGTPGEPFVVSGLHPGEYRVAASADGYDPKWAPRVYPSAATFDAGGTVTVREADDSALDAFTLPVGGSLSGVVSTAKGPAKGVQVSVYGAGRGPSFAWSGTTDAQGRFHAIGIDDRDYRVVAVGAPGYADTWLGDVTSEDDAERVHGALGADTDGADITLVAAGTIKGSLRLPTGTAITDYVVREATVVDSTGKPVAYRVVSKTGAFSIKVPVGTYRMVYALNDGTSAWATTYSKPFTVGAGQTKALDPATLKRGGTITGKVLDGAGRPMACPVLAYTEDGAVGDRAGRSSATTGAFTITGVSSAGYRLVVDRDQDCGTEARFVDLDAPGRTSADEADGDTVAGVLGGTTKAGTLYLADMHAFDTVPTPTISGKAKVGQTLTAVPGDTVPSGSTATYQWRRGSAAISGVTKATYKPVAADKGKKVSVVVTYRQTGFVPASATSATLPVT